MNKLIKCLMFLTMGIGSGYSQVRPGGLVINEVLFNPVKDGYDYVEGYNKSDTPILLETVRIANRNVTGEVYGMKPVTREPVLLPPGGYFVITANERWLRQHYMVGADALILQVASLPSFPDDQGCVVLLDSAGEVIDELCYRADWHFSLMDDVSGVALERINYSAATQDKNNWTSASSSSGYGTPGLSNSQFRADLRAEGEVIVSPKVFSPDNDWVDDFGWIHYAMAAQGYLANCMVYDISGRRIRYLLKNELLGLKGQYKWDGLDDSLRACPQGIYILVTEIFNLTGKTRKFKHSIVLARKRI